MGLHLLAGLVMTLASLKAVAEGETSSSLPQDHAYQVVLRDYLATLGKADFAVELRPFVWEDRWIEEGDEEALHRIWLLSRRGPVRGPNQVLTTAPEHYTLKAIESAEGIRLGSRFAAPEPAAWLAAWEHPVNPYHGDRGLINRALALCVVDLIMLDQLHDQGQARRSDYLGGTMIWLAYVYHKVGHHWPEEVAVAYEAGLRRQLEKMHEWGPTTVNDNMDTKSVVSMHYLARAARDPELRELARSYAARVMDRVDASGMIRDAGGLDTSYHGIATFFMAWAAIASDWAFVHQAFDRMSELKAYLTLPDDGRYTSPSHFSARTAAGIVADQWSYLQRDWAASMASEHAFYLAFGGRTGRGRDHMLADVDHMRREVRSAMTRPAPDPVDAAPPLWQENHWPYRDLNYAYDYYRDGFYDRLREAEAADAPETYAPFEREGERFIRNFADTFLIARPSDAFGVVLHTGAIGWHRYMNFAGGSLSAFWTPDGGSILQGRTGNPVHPDQTRQTWEDWRFWPTHALSGETTEGKAFSSARIRRRVAEVTYETDEQSARVTFSGPIGARHDGGRSTQDGSIQGEVSYRRQMVVRDDGLHIESALFADGQDRVAGLYEILPLFLPDPRSPDKVEHAIFFHVKGERIRATGQPVSGVTSVEVRRMDGGAFIDFQEPQQVKLSPQVWKNGPIAVRNLMIDLIAPGGHGGPLRSASIRYRIRPWTGQPAPEWDTEVFAEASDGVGALPAAAARQRLITAVAAGESESADIRDALAHESLSVRKSAILGLRNMGPEGVDLLRATLADHGDFQTRHLAMEALAANGELTYEELFGQITPTLANGADADAQSAEALLRWRFMEGPEGVGFFMSVFEPDMERERYRPAGVELGGGVEVVADDDRGLVLEFPADPGTARIKNGLTLFRELPFLSADGPFAIELWIRPGASMKGRSTHLVDKMGSGQTGTDYSVRLVSRSSGTHSIAVSLGFGESDTEGLSSPPVDLDPEQWHHLTVSYNGEGRLRVFHNRALVDEAVFEGRGALEPGSRSLTLGDRTVANHNGYSGRMTGVRFHHREIDFERALHAEDRR